MPQRFAWAARCSSLIFFYFVLKRQVAVGVLEQADANKSYACERLRLKSVQMQYDGGF